MTTNILEIFQKQTTEIKKHSEKLLRNYSNELHDINRWSIDVFKKFNDFINKGKCIRGNLVLFAYEIANGKPNKSLYEIAAAIELLQASILIHDDIIDQDEIRRGAPSIYTAYKKLVHNELHLSNKCCDHLGKSLAICMADIGFNLAYNIIANSDFPPKITSKLIQFYGVEIAKVGLAEMDDTYMSSDSSPIELSKIINLYRYKTARYTFTAPMICGLLCANAEYLIEPIEKITELLGIIFQIKDDELGIFGTEKQLGKPIGSDIREHKKTIYYYYLLKNTTDSQKRKIYSIFGNQKISNADIEYVKNIMIKSGTVNKVNEFVNNMIEQLNAAIKKLQISKIHKTQFKDFIDYNLKRTA